MLMPLIILIIILCFLGLIGTIVAIKQEENKIKKYEQEDNSVENEIKRSLEYESKSLSSNVKILSWIYIIAIVLSLVWFAIYLL